MALTKVTNDMSDAPDPAEILTAIKTVDGSTSGLDADLLDGQHGSYYTAYADTAVAGIVDSSPAALNTLNELAAALGDDASFSTTVTNSIATKAALAGANFTGAVRGTQLEAYKTNHGGDVSVAANQLGNAYENLASTASLILGATSTTLANSSKIVSDHTAASGGGTNNHTQSLSFHPVGGNSQNFEAMKIRSNGYVDIAGASDLRLTLGSQGTAGNNDANWIRGNGTSLSYNAASANHIWETGGSEKMRIDSSGNVGIGVTNVGAPLDIGSASPKIRLTDTGGGYSELRGNGGVMTLTADAGNNVANSAVTFETDGTERMRLSNTGVLTSKSHVITGIDNNAFEVKTNHSGNPSAVRVAGSGSINGVSGSFQNFTVLNVMQDSGSTNSIYAAGNIKTDGNINIGTSGKGISFSVNPNAGGMTSELLDDYEEGTWTPNVVAHTGTQPTLSYHSRSGRYTKVGDIVHVTGAFHINAMTDGSNNFFLIADLPFVIADTPVGSHTFSAINLDAGNFKITIYNSNRVGFLGPASTGSGWGWAQINTILAANSSLRFSMTYRTTA